MFYSPIFKNLINALMDNLMGMLVCVLKVENIKRLSALKPK